MEQQLFEDQPIKVSVLVALLKNDIETKHKNVKVVGEISSFKKWRSGHCYFDIKDESALIPAVMFKGFFDKLNFDISDGLEVVLSGRLSVYAAQSRLQMLVERIEPIGQGALALRFLQLKQKLFGLGFFKEEYKKQLKAFNLKVGIVTSLNGAALRDMLKIIHHRNPKISILLAPVKVQGQGAAQEIAQGIYDLDNYGFCDVIIVGRGGGSLEDLWAFNEEVVAKAIFEAGTPIISAVGHETDFSISDLVADIRAATPTHAAQLVSFDYADFNENLWRTINNLKLLLQKFYEQKNSELQIKKRLLKDPKLLIYKNMQIIDEYSLLLNNLIKKLISNNKNNLNILKNNLEKHSLIKKINNNHKLLYEAKEKLFKFDIKSKINIHKIKLLDYEKYLLLLLKKSYETKKNTFSNACSKLDSLSPLKVLSRGYGLVQNKQGKVIVSSKEITVSDELIISLSDAKILVEVKEKL